MGPWSPRGQNTGSFQHSPWEQGVKDNAEWAEAAPACGTRRRCLGNRMEVLGLLVAVSLEFASSDKSLVVFPQSHVSNVPLAPTLGRLFP